MSSPRWCVKLPQYSLRMVQAAGIDRADRAVVHVGHALRVTLLVVGILSIAMTALGLMWNDRSPAGPGLCVVILFAPIALLALPMLRARLVFDADTIEIRRIRTRRVPRAQADCFVIGRWGESPNAVWLRLHDGKPIHIWAAEDLGAGGTRRRVDMLNQIYLDRPTSGDG